MHGASVMLISKRNGVVHGLVGFWKGLFDFDFELDCFMVISFVR